MKYHNYPNAGVGTHEYSYTYKNVLNTISVNYEEYQFDWTKMHDSYSYGETGESVEEVAKLMYCVGTSINTRYGDMVTGSSATPFDVPEAIINHFGYDKACHYIKRNYYTYNEWFNILYNELKDVGPVLYGGLDNNSNGHAFICDGYDTNGFFHIHWGWGGYLDGYFRLTALNPYNRDSEGYNYNQDMVVGFQPLRENSDFYYNVLFSGNFTIDTEKSTPGGYLIITSEGEDVGADLIYNNSANKFTGTLGVFITSDDGQVSYVYIWHLDGLRPSYGYKRYPITLPKDLPDGSYIISPAFQADGYPPTACGVPTDCVREYRMIVEDGVVTFEAITPVILPEVIEIDKILITLYPDESILLSAKIFPENSSDKTLTWSSSDESVATVDGNGLVKAVGVGQAVITVKCGEVSATCEVRVLPIEVEGVTLSHSSVNLLIGDKLTVSATIVPDNATDQSLEWTVADPGIATIKVNGSTCEITGVGVGTTKLTVKASNGISATMTITVDSIKAESVTLDLMSVTLKVGYTHQLEAKITPENTTDKTLTWSSSDESVAAVDGNGLVVAVGVGQAVITVKCGDVSATCKVKVTPVLAESVKLDTQKLTLKEGETYQFGYTIWPENTTFKDVEWRSSDISVVEVSQTGLVTVKHEGEAIVTVMVLDGSGVSDNCIINAESGINDITADTRSIHVEGNTIYNDYGYIVIYTAQGALVYAGDKDQITLEIAGVYLISTADFNTKILIQ